MKTNVSISIQAPSAGTATKYQPSTTTYSAILTTSAMLVPLGSAKRVEGQDGLQQSYRLYVPQIISGLTASHVVVINTKTYDITSFIEEAQQHHTTIDLTLKTV